MRRLDVARALAVGLALSLLSSGRTISAQGPERIQPTCIQNVGLPRTDSPNNRATLILREGRITDVLPADAMAPPGTVVVDGTDLIAMPAFLDAYTRKGVATPTPKKDQDIPLNEASDVRIDMRLANRKGIQPAFQAADGLALEADAAEGWQQSGFGAALVAPGGELLAGTSALAMMRTAAARDLVLNPAVFAHAAFNASGPGYPSTLMGYISQLRQFFHDARWHDELERRYREGRPGARPAFDADLVAALPLLRSEMRLACEAESARDIERWLKLADQFGLDLAVVGGNDATRVAEVLASRGIPVVLTLDWGREVEDPNADKKDDEEAAKEGAEEGTGDPDQEEASEDPSIAAQVEEAIVAQDLVDTQDAGAEQDAEGGEEAGEESDEDEVDWTYEEPLAVRVEKRRLWEERRDVALGFAEHGVQFTFGSAEETPKKLLGKIRTLVEVGLPRDAALAALTTEAARLLGVERRLGRIAPGYDATLTLWTSDPLTDEDAQAAWVFVDGHASEFEVKEKDPAAEGEPVDAAGTWTLSTVMMGEARESTLVLIQDDDGGLTGTLDYESMDGEKETAQVSGKVRGSTIEVSGTMAFGDSSGELTLEGSLDGNTLEGTSTYRFPFSEEPFEAEVTGTRTPEILLELEHREESCHEDHAHGEVIR